MPQGKGWAAASGLCRISKATTFGSVPDHNIQNLAIGAAHTAVGKASDIGNGVFHALGHDAVAAVELTALPVHLVDVYKRQA